MAQITDSEGSANWIAARISSDSGLPAIEYLEYAHSLARTLSQFSPATQEEILGFLPGTGGGYSTPAAAISDPALSASDLYDLLLKQMPLSESDLSLAMDRTPAMSSGQLTDLLYAQGTLSKGFLISSLSKAKSSLSSSGLKTILLSNSPLDKTVVKKVETTSNLTPADIAEVLAAQGQ
jgi:hypothetical protein